ncbi:TadE/TadG family type IV pilus assembly protein [Granulicella aggregans]|jgi:Flp pilus assembly protein TadG|uniref:TadE/TadG family type IV pilus assembly protein n=1 Tax=Granulicella aggregans TaxID=474949 RepID=UPI0021E06B48|nr:TadE/TadG family type IV pilus assembly protein [Granulicella aggregans]
MSSRTDPPQITQRNSHPARLLRNESGNALVELVVLVAILGVPLLLGTAEIGLMVYDSIEISNAARVGTAYAMQSSTFASNTSGIVTAAQADASDFGTRLAVTPLVYYACSNNITGTQYTGTNAQANATSACAGGTNHPIQFVQVTTSITITPPIHCPGLPTSFPITSSSVAEVEQ